MKELWDKIKEALFSALPITLTVYLIALLPGFSFNTSELISFSVGAVLLIFGIGLFNLGAAIALSIVRIIFDFSVTYYIIPGYFISLALSLFVPPVYTAIAFDSGQRSYDLGLYSSLRCRHMCCDSGRRGCSA